MKHLKLAIVLLIPLSAAIFVACGESEPVDFGDALPAGAIQVDEKPNSFAPDDLTVATGDTVYFTNSSTPIHNVIIEGDNVSGDMERGDVATFTFGESGEFEIVCGYHPQMKATVVVE